MTEYRVFARASAQTDNWSPIGPDTVTARSARGAIEAALKGRADADSYQSYVAVPVRSWKPVTVKIETKTALHFS